jgi:hypothetical protein
VLTYCLVVSNRSAILSALAVCATACLIAGATTSRAAPASAATAGAAQSSFVSLWQPPGGRGHLVVEQFSLSTGRPLRTLLALPSRMTRVSGPYTAGDGSLWLALTTGPRIRNDTFSGDPAPRSCTGSVVRLDPASGARTTVLSLPHSMLIDDAVPSLDGSWVLMAATTCARARFNQQLLAINPSSGQRWTIDTAPARCPAISDPAWSADGSQLVFAYGPAASPWNYPVPTTTTGEQEASWCTLAQGSDLAIVPAAGASQIAAAQLIRPDRSCSYQSPTFDAWGVAAIEVCLRRGPSPGHGIPPPSVLVNYLVQLNGEDQVTLRLELKRRFGQAFLANDPSNGLVLVSAVQSQKQREATFDCVWTFNGQGLHTVGRYRSPASLAMTAEPW